MNEMHFIVVTPLPAAQADRLTSLSDSAVRVEPSSRGVAESLAPNSHTLTSLKRLLAARGRAGISYDL
jgi:hypothetical protein